MSILSDIQNRVTERRSFLQAAAFRSARTHFPYYENRPATAALREQLRDQIRHDVRRQVCEPFELEILVGRDGSWAIEVEPVMTEAEKAAQEAEFKRIDAEARAALIEVDKLRAALHPSKAPVRRIGDQLEPYVSIAGVIEDLRYWQVPPDLYNEESVGFRRALADVVRYLEKRAVA